MQPPMVNHNPSEVGGPEALHPTPHPPGQRMRLAARVALWSLMVIAAIHGFVPALLSADGPRATATSTRLIPDERRDPDAPHQGQEQGGLGVAAAFLREYLTIDHEPAARPARLKRYLARDVDLRGDVSAADGVSQLTDSVVAEHVDRLPNGLNVTVIAHLVQTREGVPADGGTVAFVVPLLSGPRGFAVSGLPRPAPLPLDPGLSATVAPLPIELARAAANSAGRAVTAMLDADRSSLARLGGGTPPSMRPFPPGWRPLRIVDIRPAGPIATPTVVVDVRARPSVAGVEYLLPVRVSFKAGSGSQIVTEIDAGGAP
jgi:hypothetical protein